MFRIPLLQLVLKQWKCCAFEWECDWLWIYKEKNLPLSGTPWTTSPKGRISESNDSLTLLEMSFIGLRIMNSPLTPPICNQSFPNILVGFALSPVFHNLPFTAFVSPHVFTNSHTVHRIAVSEQLFGKVLNKPNQQQFTPAGVASALNLAFWVCNIYNQNSPQSASPGPPRNLPALLTKGRQILRCATTKKSFALCISFIVKIKTKFVFLKLYLLNKFTILHSLLHKLIVIKILTERLLHPKAKSKAFVCIVQWIIMILSYVRSASFKSSHRMGKRNRTKFKPPRKQDTQKWLSG